jgi:hypothetical protein
MTTIPGQIMAEVLSILALSTKAMQERRISKVSSSEMSLSFLI